MTGGEGGEPPVTARYCLYALLHPCPHMCLPACLPACRSCPLPRACRVWGFCYSLLQPVPACQPYFPPSCPPACLLHRACRVWWFRAATACACPPTCLPAAPCLQGLVVPCCYSLRLPAQLPACCTVSAGSGGSVLLQPALACPPACLLHRACRVWWFRAATACACLPTCLPACCTVPAGSGGSVLLPVRLVKGLHCGPVRGLALSYNYDSSTLISHSGSEEDTCIRIWQLTVRGGRCRTKHAWGLEAQKRARSSPAHARMRTHLPPCAPLCCFLCTLCPT